MYQAELRGPFHKDGDVVPDGTVVEQLVFFGNDILYGGALFIGEAFGQAVDDCHECPDFGFCGHSQVSTRPVRQSTAASSPRGWFSSSRP